MLVNEGQLDGARILSPESVRSLCGNSLPEGMTLYGSRDEPGRPGRGFGLDFAVVLDPQAADTRLSTGSYYWAGAAGTWFWIDPAEDMFWIGMIQARGESRPGAADMRQLAEDHIYDALEAPEP